MTRLDEIKTKKYTREQIIEMANRAAKDGGESWVLYDSITEYNENIPKKTHTRLRRLLSFIFNDKPIIGFLGITLLPALILSPLCFTLGAVGAIVTAFGALIGFIVASFSLPSAFAYCPICKSFGSCKQIYSYTLKTDERIERLANGRDERISLCIKENLDFVILECEKCKGRKIEIIKDTKENIL